MPLSCRLGQTNLHPQGLYIAVRTHNCGILSNSGGASLGYATSISPHKPHCNSFLSYTILLANPTFKPFIHWTNPPTKRLPTYTLSESNTIIPHSFIMAKPSEITFINPLNHPFITLHNSLICAIVTIHFPNTKQTSEFVHLYSLIPRPLLSLHIIFLVPYNRTGMSNVSCITLAHWSYRESGTVLTFSPPLLQTSTKRLTITLRSSDLLHKTKTSAWKRPGNLYSLPSHLTAILPHLHFQLFHHSIHIHIEELRGHNTIMSHIIVNSEILALTLFYSYTGSG